MGSRQKENHFLLPLGFFSWSTNSFYHDIGIGEQRLGLHMCGGLRSLMVEYYSALQGGCGCWEWLCHQMNSLSWWSVWEPLSSWLGAFVGKVSFIHVIKGKLCTLFKAIEREGGFAQHWRVLSFFLLWNNPFVHCEYVLIKSWLVSS